jgi:hypothetical protein
MFTMLVMMAIITTAMAGPLLSIIFPPNQLVKERAADMAANAAAKGKPLNDGVARLVVLVHDAQSGSKLLEAAVATLAPNMRAHLDVAQFSPPGELHTQTEMGTGLLCSPEEMNAKSMLQAQVAAVERRSLTSRVTVRTTDEPLQEALVHIHALNPQLVVTDWPQGPEERARLRDLVVASPCTVVLWGGFSPTAAPAASAVADAAAAAHGKGGEEGQVVVPIPQAPVARQPKKTRPSLLLLLRSDAAQDEFVDDTMARAWASAARAQAALLARLPAFFKRDPALGNAAAEEDEDEDEEHGGGDPKHARVRVDKSVVTPQTMAVAAASSLSPKFSKLMITGWPTGEYECAELIKFLRDVEHEVSAQRLSMESRRQTERLAGSFAMPDREILAPIGELDELGGQQARAGKHSRQVSDDMDSVTTVGPMLGKVLGAALQRSVSLQPK